MRDQMYLKTDTVQEITKTAWTPCQIIHSLISNSKISSDRQCGGKADHKTVPQLETKLGPTKLKADSAPSTLLALNVAPYLKTFRGAKMSTKREWRKAQPSNKNHAATCVNSNHLCPYAYTTSQTQSKNAYFAKRLSKSCIWLLRVFCNQSASIHKLCQRHHHTFCFQCSPQQQFWNQC